MNDTVMANAYVPGRALLSPAQQAMVDARAKLLGPAYRLMYDSPLHFVRGEGVWLFDQNGKRYLDAYNNVASLGHCHPAVVEAICLQAGTLATNTRYLHHTILDLADRLLATMPAQLGHVMLTCTGSEANDLAWRIARSFTRGTGIIVTETAYHGITDAVAQFSPSLGAAVDLGQHVVTIPAPNDNDAVGQFAISVEDAVARLRRRGVRPAMLIVDSMFTSDGVQPEPTGFLARAAEAIRKAGGLFVADEVQPGFARTGGHMWGFQRHGVVPDIVTMGKPMGNGHPVAGLAVAPEVVAEFGRTARYFNTFGGNAVSCAAAMAVLDTIRAEDVQGNAQRMGQRLAMSLTALRRRHPTITGVRAAGLLVGVEIKGSAGPDRVETARLVNGMLARGVMISSCGRHQNVLKIRPPLVIAPAEVDLIAATLDDVLNDV